MSPPRREFLKSTTAAVALTAIGRSSQADESRSEKLQIGFIGCGGMGSNHLKLLSQRKDVEVAIVCDVDQQRLADAAKMVQEGSGKAPKSTGDLRTILDDKSIDAVFIATPDHWHAPAAILALDAGKHVYVEKPCCHNVREGRLLAEAVKRSGKRLQVGTQSRSTPCVAEGIERVRNGEIGEILVAKAWNSQRRGTIGKAQPGSPPPHLDFDNWLGPAPEVQWRPNLLHGIWRWWYDFGCGDIGNDGVHDIDVALWGLGVETHPSRVTCFGQKNFFDDDQQFPDTQYAVCEYPVDGSPAGRCKQLIFEQRIWSPYVQEGYENGAAFYGKEGVLVMGHSIGWKLYGPRGKLLGERTGGGDLPAHHQNFFDAIRDPAKSVNASVDAGRLSATIVHLANIAARTGQVLHFDPDKEVITNGEAANALVRRKYREGHWAVPTGSCFFRTVPPPATTELVMAKYKVAIIGSTGRGDYGHGLDAVWQSIEHCEVVAVADQDEAGRNKAVPRTGAARSYADYREMLDKEKPNIVAVCPRWIDQHRDMVLACAEHGCHMYMEKPFCRTLSEADEMIQACEMRHLKLAVAHISRYSPQLDVIRKLIQAGEIGDVLEIRARGKEDARGGAEDLWVLGTHVLDLMRAFAGEPETCYASLYQDAKRVTREHIKPGNEGVGPLAGNRVDAMWRFKSGVTGYFSSKKGAGGSPNRFGLRIMGSKGVIDHTSGYANPAFLLNDATWGSSAAGKTWRTISSNGIDQPETITATGYEGGNPAAARDLIAAIEEDRQPKCSMYEARGTIEMVLSVFESHRAGGPISMPLQCKANPLGELTE